MVRALTLSPRADWPASASKVAPSVETWNWLPAAWVVESTKPSLTPFRLIGVPADTVPVRVWRETMAPLVDCMPPTTRSPVAVLETVN